MAETENKGLKKERRKSKMAKRKRVKKNRGYGEKIRARQTEARRLGLGSGTTYPIIWIEKKKREAIRQ